MNVSLFSFGKNNKNDVLSTTKIVDTMKQRRISLILVFILCNTVVWSWTSQKIIYVPLPARTYANSVSSAIEKGSYDRKKRIIGLSINFEQTRSASTASFCRNSLLILNHQVSDLAIDYSELTHSLLKANTTQEVDVTLRRALLPQTIKEKANVSSSEVFIVYQYVEVDDEEVNLVDIPFSRLSLNATAAILRRMAHISVLESRMELAKNRRYGYYDGSTTDIILDSGHESKISGNSLRLQRKMISNLLEATGIKLMSHRLFSSTSSSKSSSFPKNTQNEQALPGVYPLSDILQALAVLSNNSITKGKMRPFAILVVKFLNMHTVLELYKLGPIRLVQCLQAMAKLDIDHALLQYNIFQRLLKPDAVSKLPARFLSHGLSALATFQSTKRKASKLSHDKKFMQDYNNDDDIVNRNDTIQLSKVFMRRLRKRKVAQEASVQDMCRSLTATRDLLNLGAMTNMEDEAAMFGFTGIRTILERKSSTLSSLLTATQMTAMISSWASLSDQNRKDTVITDLLQICIDDNILKGCNLGQLELIVRSIRKLNVIDHAEVAKSVGERFLMVVEENKILNFENIYPSSTNEILRWSALFHRRNIIVIEPFMKTASLLFTNRSFLERSTVEEIANFLWFLSITHCFDEKVLLKIGDSLMKTEIIDRCSPKIASRILATFTSLVVLKGESASESLMDLKQDLFYSYGGHLLSSSLSPAEISSALYAYAKANYVQDMGIFDHLVKLLTSYKHVCSSRQLSQTLWACGKMITWELQQVIDLPEEQNNKIENPPYLEDALSITRELSSRIEELSSADIAQIIWAMGKLEIKDDKLMSQFANRAVGICSSMNSIEVSNILWGIVRVQYNDRKLIGSLSDRLTSNDIRISPRVAGSVLFSMGKLCWKDEYLFHKLSRTMIDQIQDVNAQSIANTLWAFRAIRLRAPHELLNIWAITRLGIVPASEKQRAES